MSNKLYTEDQVRKALWQTQHPFSDGKHVNEIINSLTPIELPTDKDIEEMVHYNPNFSHIAFGVKWLRDLIIQGGNNGTK